MSDAGDYLAKLLGQWQLRAILGVPSKGNVYQVPIPATDTAPGSTMAGGATVANDATMALHARVAPGACVVPHATNNDDDIKIQSSSKGGKFADDTDPLENHSCAAAPRE